MGAQRALSGLSAFAFGILGWFVWHGLTSRLLEQHRHQVIDTGVHPQSPSYLGALGSVAAGMAVGTLLATFFLGGQLARGREPGLPAGSRLRRSTRAASALSTTGFVVAELVGRAAVGDHQVAPVTMLLVGGALQMLVASVTCVLWRSCVRSVQRLRSQPCPVSEPATVDRAGPDMVAATQTWFSDRAGRAPPFAGVSPRPTFV
jgi:hypothetical protein